MKFTERLKILFLLGRYVIVFYISLVKIVHILFSHVNTVLLAHITRDKIQAKRLTNLNIMT